MQAMLQRRAKSLGQAIGFLHACFLKCDGLSGYADMQFIKQIQEWAIPCIRKHENTVDSESIQKIWREIELDLESLYADLPNQLIHRDPNPANILFDKAKVTGFVDFEMVSRGPRIFDVCYCGTSLLISGFPDQEKMRKWPTLFHSLLKGYQEVFPLTSAELSALYGTMVAIEIIFAAFSLETKAEGAARCNASVLEWLSENKEPLEFAG